PSQGLVLREHPQVVQAAAPSQEPTDPRVAQPPPFSPLCSLQPQLRWYAQFRRSFHPVQSPARRLQFFARLSCLFVLQFSKYAPNLQMSPENRNAPFDDWGRFESRTSILL